MPCAAPCAALRTAQAAPPERARCSRAARMVPYLTRAAPGTRMRRSGAEAEVASSHAVEDAPMRIGSETVSSGQQVAIGGSASADWVASGPVLSIRDV